MSEPNNVFISWSGTRSKVAAKELTNWLPAILQRARPWMSEEDIQKGSRGLDEVAGALKTMKVGIHLPNTREPERALDSLRGGVLRPRRKTPKSVPTSSAGLEISPQEPNRDVPEVLDRAGQRRIRGKTSAHRQQQSRRKPGARNPP